MRITGNSIHTSGYSPGAQQAAADARVERRNEEFQQKSIANDEQKRKDLQASGEVVTGVSRDEGLGYRRVAEATGANKQFALYENDDNSVPNSQRKAIQAYTETENISRVDADIDYLGSVDIFV